MYKQPFPVAIMHLRPANFGVDPPRCKITGCQSEGDMARALFLARPCIAPEDIREAKARFPREQAHALTWQKAYHAQKRGEDGPNVGYAMCMGCARAYVAGFANDATNVSYILAVSVGSKLDIMLFDRNIDKSQGYPGILLGRFQSLEEFRQHYWQKLSEVTE